MNEHQFQEKLKESKEFHKRVKKMAGEAIAIESIDFKKSNDMLMESMRLQCEGNKIFLQAAQEAFDSGLMDLTEEEERRLDEYLSRNNKTKKDMK